MNGHYRRVPSTGTEGDHLRCCNRNEYLDFGCAHCRDNDDFIELNDNIKKLRRTFRSTMVTTAAVELRRTVIALATMDCPLP